MWGEKQERLLIRFIAHIAIAWSLKRFFMTIRQDLALV
jgi:hypothetical protein